MSPTHRETREHRLQRRVHELEQRLEAQPLALHALPVEYALELATLASMALSGVRRPDTLGYVKAGHADSKPPAYHQQAMARLAEEQRELRRRAQQLRVANHQHDAAPSERSKTSP